VKDYLVILTGLPRGGSKSWESLEKNVIQNLDADLAICTEDNIDKNLHIYKIADYHWLFPERENWLEYYLENYSSNSIEVLKKGKGAGLWESGVVHLALKDFILKNHLDIVNNYKYIIYGRFDQYYTEKHPHFYGENIWIPNGEDYFGINDRHAIINVKFISEYLNICNFIDSLNPQQLQEKYLNCETIYKMHLESFTSKDEIIRIKRFQFTSATKKDFTRWRVPKYSLVFDKNLMIKYPDEFLDSIKRTRKFRFLISINFTDLDLVLTFYYLSLRRLIGKLRKRYFK
jgi:hypothetical protein